MLNFVCPQCGENYETEDDMFGKKVSCESCSARFYVPKNGETAKLVLPKTPIKLDLDVIDAPKKQCTNKKDMLSSDFVVYNAENNRKKLYISLVFFSVISVSLIFYFLILPNTEFKRTVTSHKIQEQDAEVKYPPALENNKTQAKVAFNDNKFVKSKEQYHHEQIEIAKKQTLSGIKFSEDWTVLKEYNKNLSAIQYVIPGCVTSIGDKAFAECKNLKSITISNGITNIGKAAFWECINLNSIIIPNSVTSIGEEAFSGCRNLRSISIPSSVTNIEKLTFAECSNLNSIYIEKKFNKNIIPEAYRKYIKLMHVDNTSKNKNEQNQVKIKKAQVISECLDVKDLQYMPNESNIDNLSFFDIRKIINYFKDSYEAIKKFEKIQKNDNISKKEKMFKIKKTFSKEFALYREFINMDGETAWSRVNEIGRKQHIDANDPYLLRAIEFGIAKAIFLQAEIYHDNWIRSNKMVDFYLNSCIKNLKLLVRHKYAPAFHLIGIISTEQNDLEYGKKCLKQAHELGYVVSTMELVAEEISNKNGKNAVFLLSGGIVTAIFNDTAGIDNAPMRIGMYEFKSIPWMHYELYRIYMNGCGNLLPNKAKAIECIKAIEEFYTDDETEFCDFKKYLRDVAKDKFVFDIFDNLKEKNVCKDNRISVKRQKAGPSSTKKHIHHEQIEIAKKQTLSGIKFSEDWTVLKEYNNNLTATEYTIPSCVKIIGENAFIGNTKLHSITIPNSVTVIGIAAFHGCTNLSSITIPNSVTKIEDGAFSRCSNLRNITLPSSIINIGNAVFAGSSNLDSIYVDKNFNKNIIPTGYWKYIKVIRDDNNTYDRNQNKKSAQEQQVTQEIKKLRIIPECINTKRYPNINELNFSDIRKIIINFGGSYKSIEKFEKILRNDSKSQEERMLEVKKTFSKELTLYREFLNMNGETAWNYVCENEFNIFGYLSPTNVYLQRAVDFGIAEAIHQQALSYLTEYDRSGQTYMGWPKAKEEKFLTLAIKKLKLLEAHDYAPAIQTLGKVAFKYLSDTDLACNFFTKAHDLGHAYSTLELLTIVKLQRNGKLAVSLLEKAIELANNENKIYEVYAIPRLNYELYCIYRDGCGDNLLPDKNKALEYIKKIKEWYVQNNKTKRDQIKFKRFLYYRVPLFIQG